MPSLAGALTSLGLLGVAAVPSPSYQASVAATSDTWSLSSSDASTVSIVFPITSAGDTWSLKATEGTGSIGTYPEQLTELYLLGVAGNYGAVGAKAFTSTNLVTASDTWSLQWNEDPLSTLAADTWDTWRLSSADASALSILQTFAAADVWALSSSDVSSLVTGAPVALSTSDPWALSATDASAVAVSVASAGDTLSLTWTEAASSVAVSQDAIAASDTWSLSSAETSLIQTVVQIPLLGSDQWSLAMNDLSSLMIFQPPAPDLSPGRVILVRAQAYIVRVR